MSPKKIDKRNVSLKSLQSIVKKNLDFNKIDLNPGNLIDSTKNKIGNYYANLKKRR